ncbi:MAG: Hint domain-containing protein [Rhodobacteraceae bacterium]|nr:Hint domain-containing protein [Paracoccaceae bacterium]
MSIVSPIVPVNIDVAQTPRGFLRGTRMMSPSGWRMVESLQVGDILSCCRDEPVRVSAVRAVMVSRPGAKAIWVTGEARGQGRGAEPLYLSPEQMIVVAGDLLAAYFGVEEALAPVGALVDGRDLRLVDAPMTEIWYEIETEEPCALVVEGLQVAVGVAGRDTRPVLSAAEARLLALAA